jgi:hypothetical protein
MAETRDVVERALRQAFRAGWWWRERAPMLGGATVEARNCAEDKDVPGMAKGLVKALLEAEKASRVEEPS